MNYFEFYNIPLQFYPDQKIIKHIFFVKSKQYHPDFYTLDGVEKQMEALEMATLNNKAYNTLKNEAKRIKYILTLKGELGEEGKEKLPQEFLMEMMDINESLMEIQVNFDPKQYDQVVAEIAEFESQILSLSKKAMEAYDKGEEDMLSLIKTFHLKSNYLKRLQSNLDKIKNNEVRM